MVKVRVVKLVTGEDIIGAVEEKKLGNAMIVLIKFPLSLVIRPKENEENKFVLGLGPWAPYAKNNEVPVFPSQIISIFDPDENLLAEYNNRNKIKLVAKEPQQLNEEAGNV